MSSHCVTKISGIGPGIASTLKLYKITTVGELANVVPGSFKIPNLGTFISRAKLYISEREPQFEKSKDTLVVDGQYKVNEQVVPQCNAKNDEEVESKMLITNHSWFEKEVIIPDDNQMKNAIVFELSIDPNNRVSLICANVEDEQLCKMTYSPQLLMTLNAQTLPEFTVSIDPADWKTLKNKHTIVNTLFETNVIKMLRFQ